MVCCLALFSPSETRVSGGRRDMLGLMINLQTMLVIPADVLSCRMSAQLIPPTPHYSTWCNCHALEMLEHEFKVDEKAPLIYTPWHCIMGMRGVSKYGMLPPRYEHHGRLAFVPCCQLASYPAASWRYCNTHFPRFLLVRFCPLSRCKDEGGRWGQVGHLRLSLSPAPECRRRRPLPSWSWQRFQWRGCYNSWELSFILLWAKARFCREDVCFPANLSFPLNRSGYHSPSNIPGLVHVNTPSGQVALVANHHHWHLLCILHPFDLLPILCDIFEGLGIVNRKYNQEAFSSSHVLIPHGTVLL